MTEKLNGLQPSGACGAPEKRENLPLQNECFQCSPSKKGHQQISFIDL